MKQYTLQVLGVHVLSIFADRVDTDEEGRQWYYAGEQIVGIGAVPRPGVVFAEFIPDAVIQSESCATAQIPAE